MKNNKGFALILVIGVILIVSVLTAGGVLVYQQNKNAKKAIGGDKDEHGCLTPAGYSWCEAKNKCLRTWEEKCEKETAVKDETAGWKIYKNEEYGFEFKYPSGFFYGDPKALIGNCNYGVFPAQCPNINDIVINEEITQGGDPDAIRQNVSLIPEAKKTTINNTLYCLQGISDGTMSHTYSTYYYTTVVNQKCFVLRLVTSIVSCGVYGFPGEKAYDDCEKYNTITQPQTFNQIISTFKFTR